MKRLVISGLFLLLPIAVSAQTPVINPNFAQFTASVDHNTVENTVPLVTSYELRIFQSGGTTPVKLIDLGKPTPDGTNTIVATITTSMKELPPGDYFGRVAAKGPGGENVSASSNPFQIQVRAPAAPINLLFIR